MEEIAFQDASPIRKKRKNLKKIFVVFLVLFFFVALIIFIIHGLSSGENQVQQSSTPSPSVNSSQTPIPTTSPASSSTESSTNLDRANLKVRVENGSGGVGIASHGSSFLKNLGYNVISSGNAASFDYVGVTIQIKNSQKKFIDLLSKDLSASYKVSSTSSDLSEDSQEDVLVIIGK